MWKYRLGNRMMWMRLPPLVQRGAGREAARAGFSGRVMGMRPGAFQIQMIKMTIQPVSGWPL